MTIRWLRLLRLKYLELLGNYIEKIIYTLGLKKYFFGSRLYFPIYLEASQLLFGKLSYEVHSWFYLSTGILRLTNFLKMFTSTTLVRIFDQLYRLIQLFYFLYTTVYLKVLFYSTTIQRFSSKSCLFYWKLVSYQYFSFDVHEMYKKYLKYCPMFKKMIKWCRKCDKQQTWFTRYMSQSFKMEGDMLIFKIVIILSVTTNGIRIWIEHIVSH